MGALRILLLTFTSRFVIDFLSIRKVIITPHAQRERGKVIGRGVHIHTYIIISMWSKKIIESYFRDRLTFSNVDSRTSR